MTNPIAQAIAATKSIVKDARNDFAKYDYASADAVYEAVRGALAEAGLSIWQHEVEFKQVTNAKGEIVSAWATYEMGFRTGLGRPEAVEHLTVPAKMTGSQTAAALRTFALKYWLRGALLLPTGEQDLDAEDRINPVPSAPAPSKPAPKASPAPVTVPAPEKVVREEPVVPPEPPPPAQADIDPALDAMLGREERRWVNVKGRFERVQGDEVVQHPTKDDLRQLYTQFRKMLTEGLPEKGSAAERALVKLYDDNKHLFQVDHVSDQARQNLTDYADALRSGDPE